LLALLLVWPAHAAAVGANSYTWTPPVESGRKTTSGETSAPGENDARKQAPSENKADPGQSDAVTKGEEGRDAGKPDAGKSTEDAPGQVSSAAAPKTIEEALAAGDFTAAQRLAETARKADPSPQTWHQEALVHEQAGNFAGAKAAYQQELELLPRRAKDRRKQVEAALQRVEARARGIEPSEPTSSHRAELDKNWRHAAKTKRTRKPASEPLVPSDGEVREPIVRKWYFWVAAIAIVAAAGTVTGLAIKASQEKRSDALEAAQVGGGTATILRF
jgi:tetratricopeptide (TPR) repeat protein